MTEKKRSWECERRNAEEKETERHISIATYETAGQEARTHQPPAQSSAEQTDARTGISRGLAKSKSKDTLVAGNAIRMLVEPGGKSKQASSPPGGIVEKKHRAGAMATPILVSQRPLELLQARTPWASGERSTLWEPKGSHCFE